MPLGYVYCKSVWFTTGWGARNNTPLTPPPSLKEDSRGLLRNNRRFYCIAALGIGTSLCASELCWPPAGCPVPWSSSHRHTSSNIESLPEYWRLGLVSRQCFKAMRHYYWVLSRPWTGQTGDFWSRDLVDTQSSLQWQIITKTKLLFHHIIPTAVQDFESFHNNHDWDWWVYFQCWAQTLMVFTQFCSYLACYHFQIKNS